MRRRLPPLLLWLTLAGGLVAHPEIEDALRRLNARIAATPGDPELFLERAALYARHEDWINAEANLSMAAELNPRHPAVARARGALALATGQPGEAVRHLNAALALVPDDPAARLLRARAHARLGDRPAAARDYAAALAGLDRPSPEFFLERAAVLDPPEALRSLDDAAARLGDTPSLQEQAAALEEKLGCVEAAAARYTRLARQSERPELWLIRRGDLLVRASRPAEAAVAYREALQAVAALPDWLRESPETVSLISRLQALLTRLPASPP